MKGSKDQPVMEKRQKRNPDNGTCADSTSWCCHEYKMIDRRE